MDVSWIGTLIETIIKLVITLIQNIDWATLLDTTVQVTSGLITTVAGAIN